MLTLVISPLEHAFLERAYQIEAERRFNAGTLSMSLGHTSEEVLQSFTK